MSKLRVRYDHALKKEQITRDHWAKVKAERVAVEKKFQRVDALLKEHSRELEEARRALDEALDGVADQANTPAETTVPGEPATVSSPPGPARRLPKSLTDLVEAFPLDTNIGLKELRQALHLSDGGLNARIQNAKKAELVEKVGWGQYQLTDTGRAVRSKKPRLVSTKGA